MELRVCELKKRYGTQWALKGISFIIDKPGIYGYLGPNGAGKSTTFKILTGYLRPTSGTVWLGDWQLPNHKKEIQRHIGYLPENNPLYLEMYVREYLLFRGGLYGMRGRTLRQRVEFLIERVGLEPEAHKLIGFLSRGYRQRVGLAAALLHDPPLLILDEPTSGLDPNQVIEIRQLIRSLGTSHQVIFSSHILAEVQAIADHVLILHKGELVLNASLKEIDRHIGWEEYWVETAGPSLNWGFLPEGARAEHLGEAIWRVIIPSGTEIRQAIYQASVQQGVPLLRLEKRQHQLEEVFHHLTAEERYPIVSEKGFQEPMQAPSPTS
ncbi:MAG: ATP-binding cassette domain-containing protein [Bacteroidia bacterium]|nr:ATP-binding cassette domain-containing protein [Bacteroidia bacterium]MDW8015548.1 ATP-binding cassette domain-containing protein [Bacteroidia bacterium]